MEQEKNIYFLEENSFWKADFNNYVNMRGGIKQQGKMQMIIEVKDNVVTLKNKFFNLEGKQSDYEGSSKMRIEGEKLISLDNSDIDPNTNNAIENHVFNGIITPNHIYIFEEYNEILSKEKKEHRRNESHYFFLNKDELVNIFSVYLNDELLVFGSAHFLREK